jgi:hypothetical protein
MVTDLKKELVTKSGELAHLIEERDGFVTQRTTELEDMKRTEDGLLNTVSTLQALPHNFLSFVLMKKYQIPCIVFL